MSEFLSKTISPSAVNAVLSGEQYFNGMTPEAREGQRQHKLVLEAIKEKREGLIPPVLKFVSNMSPIMIEATVKKPLWGEELTLGGRADLLGGEGVVLEMKTHRDIRMRDILQLVFCCNITQRKTGYLYLKGSESLYKVVGGGSDYWGITDEMAIISRRLLDNQLRYKTFPRNSADRRTIAENSIEQRSTLDNLSKQFDEGVWPKVLIWRPN